MRQEERLAYALGQVDQRFLAEAAPEERMRPRRIRRGVWAACLALALILGASAVFAAGLLDPLGSYFEGKTEFYLEEILSHVCSVSNE